MRILGWCAALSGAFWTAFILLVIVLAETGVPMVGNTAAIAPAPGTAPRSRAAPVPETTAAGDEALRTSPAMQAASVEDSEDDYQGLPPGVGRDEVLGLCGSCHSMKLVTQQGLSRVTWVEVLEFMVEEQEMPELEPNDEQLVLDYLEKYYGPDRLARKLANRDFDETAVQRPVPEIQGSGNP